jgi:hypothetical protein
MQRRLHSYSIYEGSRDVHTVFTSLLAVGKGKYRHAFSAVSATPYEQRRFHSRKPDKKIWR